MLPPARVPDPLSHQDAIAELRVRVLPLGFLHGDLVKEFTALRHLHHQFLRDSRRAPERRQIAVDGIMGGQ